MFNWVQVSTALMISTLVVPGCTTIFGLPNGGGAELAPLVAAKATDVADRIGGANGFGGRLMDGYFDHMPGQMGFGGAGESKLHRRAPPRSTKSDSCTATQKGA